MSRQLQKKASRFRGTVVGALIGDAIAFPYQHYSRDFLRSHVQNHADGYGEHHAGFYPKGQYSDDGQVLLAVIDSIADAGRVSGENLATHFVPLWRDNRLIEREASSALAMEKLVQGSTTWNDSGLPPGHAEIAPVTRAVAIGLWAHGRDGELTEAVRTCTGITHTDPRVLAAAAATAAGIAHNLHTDELVLGPFLDALSNASEAFDPRFAEELLDFPRVLSMPDVDALRHFGRIHPDDAYPTSSEGLGTYCIPAFWTAIYSFLRSPYSFVRGVDSCVRAGGNIDSPALLTGALCGALLGEEGLPDTLVSDLVGSAELRPQVNRFFHACVDSLERTPEEVDAEPPPA